MGIISNPLNQTIKTHSIISNTTSSSNNSRLPFPVTLTFRTPTNYSQQQLYLSRRIFLPSVSVSGIWDALTGGSNNNAREAVLAIRRGMLLFRQVLQLSHIGISSN